jgi:hypothetical protein
MKQQNFDGLTGGDLANPLILKDKFKIEGSQWGFFICVSKNGYWYLHDNGNIKWGTTSNNSTGYFITLTYAQRVLNKLEKELRN